MPLGSLESRIMAQIHQIFKTTAKAAWCHDPNNELSYGKHQALHAISEGKRSMTEIAEELQIALPTATVIVNKLVEAKLVKRQSKTTDRRVIEITITAKGAKILGANEEAKASHIKTILSVLSKQDKETLVKILTKISGRI